METEKIIFELKEAQRDINLINHACIELRGSHEELRLYMDNIDWASRHIILAMEMIEKGDKE